jgi:hypothetical protein
VIARAVGQRQGSCTLTPPSLIDLGHICGADTHRARDTIVVLTIYAIIA